MRDVLISHSGRQHSYKVALSLQKINRLSRFITSSYYNTAVFPDRFLSKFDSLDRILRRRYEEGISDRVKRFPIFEMPELVLRAFVGNCRISSDAVCIRDVLFDKFVAKTQVRSHKIFWGFQGSCLESLKEAKRNGMITVEELTIGHITAAIRILEEEKIKNPEWADSITNLYFPKWYLERLKEEPFVADYCIVSSMFSKKTLEEAGVEPTKILILPLGVDIRNFKFRKRKMDHSFQILFVGQVGQRKGIKYLLETVKRLNTSQITLKLIGPIIGSGRALKSYSDFYEYLGVLNQEEIVKYMHESDCLVLPSLFEGFGLVIIEAMAAGMPVIASTHSAAPDIIREGVDGFSIEPCNTECLAEKLEWLMTYRDETVEMGVNAAKRAKEFSWEMHSKRLEAILNQIES